MQIDIHALLLDRLSVAMARQVDKGLTGTIGYRFTHAYGAQTPSDKNHARETQHIYTRQDYQDMMHTQKMASIWRRIHPTGQELDAGYMVKSITGKYLSLRAHGYNLQSLTACYPLPLAGLKG